MSSLFPQIGALPGNGSIVQTTEKNVTWGQETDLLIKSNEVISSATVDSTNTPTTYLRGGLLLGKITSSGELIQYSPTATDGSQVVYGVLRYGLSMLGTDGSAVDRTGVIIVRGPVVASELIGLDLVARKQMSQRFVFDDDVQNLGGLDFVKVVDKAANYTIVAADHGTKFTMSAAATFTLPALAAGLAFEFYNLVDANMAITSAGSADDIIVDGDLAADTITYSTASHKIGSACRVVCNNAGTKWLATNIGATTITAT